MKLADEHGAVLTGRARAIDLRQVLAQELDAEGCIVLDFEGVETVSPSFADELFGRFVDQVGEDKVRFANLNSHLTTVANMIRRRRGGAAV